jgi:hypothetical protein
MISEKKKNWIEIEAFDKLHLMTITEYNEFGGSVSSTSVASYGIDNSPKYRKDDVDARMKIYKKYRHNRNDFVSSGGTFLCPANYSAFQDWLFDVFCFGDMQENFAEKIKEMEKQK